MFASGQPPPRRICCLSVHVSCWLEGQHAGWLHFECKLILDCLTLLSIPVDARFQHSQFAEASTVLTAMWSSTVSNCDCHVRGCCQDAALSRMSIYCTRWQTGALLPCHLVALHTAGCTHCQHRTHAAENSLCLQPINELTKAEQQPTSGGVSRCSSAP